MAGKALRSWATVSTCAAAMLLTTVGCATSSSSSTATVAHLPPPSFNGPTVAAPVAAPQPLAVAPAPSRQLTGSAAWQPRVAPRAWKWIVVHHSATPAGSAGEFDKMHKQTGWDELGYHFVIGNGAGSADGRIEVGPRWPRQKWGAHAKTTDNRYNDYGIGICLVGNFDMERPTPAQMASLAKLTAYLMKTYRIPADRIIGHGDTKATDCPGKFMSIAQVRRAANQALAQAGEPVESHGGEPALAPDAVAATAREELLTTGAD